MPVLEVKNLEKRFGASDVLRGVSFSMREGEVLSLIGPSGGGKTTLLRCLNFLEKPDGGSIEVDGEVVWDSTMRRPAAAGGKLFGMVFQSFHLFPHYTVKKNLTLAASLAVRTECRAKKATREQLREALAAVDSRADEWLEKVGLSEKAGAYPTSLSGGQQQRAAIARALMLSPRILCFDEPTSALDPALTGEVLRVIRSLREEGRTMVIVTHEMAFARAVSDRVIFMAGGVIAEEGAPDALFDDPQTDALRAFLAGADAARKGE